MSQAREEAAARSAYATQLVLFRDAQAIEAATGAPVRGAPSWIHSALARFYQGFLEVVVFSSIWVAAALASFTLFTAHVMQLPFDLRPFLLVFFSGLFIYILDHVNDTHVEGIPDAFAEHFFKRKAVLILMVAAAIATGLTVSTAPPAAKWAFGFYTAVGLLYGVPVLPLRTETGWRAFRLKEIPGVKAWLVALAMTVGGVLLPLGWTESRILDGSGWFLFLFLFVYSASAAHVFDVRDMVTDAKSGVSTMPMQLGLRRTKYALYALNLVMLALMMWGWAGGTTDLHPEIIVCTIFTIVYVALVREDTPRDVYSIVIDGCLFLPALLSVAHHAIG